MKVIKLTRDSGTGCCGTKVYSVRLGNGSGADFRYTRNIDFETFRDLTPKSGNFKKWLFYNPKVIDLPESTLFVSAVELDFFKKSSFSKTRYSSRNAFETRKSDLFSLKAWYRIGRSALYHKSQKLP